MKASFTELSSFLARRPDYLTDDEFREFQNVLMNSPTAGNVIAGTGGLRTIYYWQDDEATFWLFMIYDKDEMEDLSKDEKKALKQLLKEALGNG